MAIHCIQVHKETIEKIPNALPNRNSVDIEIYGMEGIPEADLREHERQKGSNMPFPTPSSIGPPTGVKMPSSSATTAAAAVAVATGMIPPQAVLNIPPPAGASYPLTNFMGIPPPYPPPGMVPPASGDPGNPYALPQPGFSAVPPPPSLIPPQQIINTPPPIPGIAPSKPLFPSGSNGEASASSVVGSDFKPLSGSSSAAAIISKPASTVASTGSTSKIIHPEEDISLEEIRARNFFTQSHKFHYNNVAGENR